MKELYILHFVDQCRKTDWKYKAMNNAGIVLVHTFLLLSNKDLIIIYLNNLSKLNPDH